MHFSRSEIAVASFVAFVASLASGCGHQSATATDYSPIWVPQGSLLCAAYQHAASVRFESRPGGGTLVFVARPGELPALRRELMQAAPRIDQRTLRLSTSKEGPPTSLDWSLKSARPQRSAHGGGSGMSEPLRTPSHAQVTGSVDPPGPVSTRLVMQGNEARLRVTAKVPDDVADLRRVLQEHAHNLYMGQCDWKRVSF